MLCKKAKKNIFAQTLGLLKWKNVFYGRKKFGLGCKIFMGTRDIERKKPNCKAYEKKWC